MHTMVTVAIACVAQLVLLTPNRDLHFAIDEQFLFQLAAQLFDQLHALGVDDALLRLRLLELSARRVCLTVDQKREGRGKETYETRIQCEMFCNRLVLKYLPVHEGDKRWSNMSRYAGGVNHQDDEKTRYPSFLEIKTAKILAGYSTRFLILENE